jgi:hypothetical protein
MAIARSIGCPRVPTEPNSRGGRTQRSFSWSTVHNSLSINTFIVIKLSMNIGFVSQKVPFCAAPSFWLPRPSSSLPNGFVFGFLRDKFPRRLEQNWVRFPIFTFFTAPPPVAALGERGPAVRPAVDASTPLVSHWLITEVLGHSCTLAPIPPCPPLPYIKEQLQPPRPCHVRQTTSSDKYR